MSRDALIIRFSHINTKLRYSLHQSATFYDLEPLIIAYGDSILLYLKYAPRNLSPYNHAVASEAIYICVGVTRRRWPKRHWFIARRGNVPADRYHGKPNSPSYQPGKDWIQGAIYWHQVQPGTEEAWCANFVTGSCIKRARRWKSAYWHLAWGRLPCVVLQGRNGRFKPANSGFYNLLVNYRAFNVTAQSLFKQNKIGVAKSLKSS